MTVLNLYLSIIISAFNKIIYALTKRTYKLSYFCHSFVKTSAFVPFNSRYTKAAIFWAPGTKITILHLGQLFRTGSLFSVKKWKNMCTLPLKTVAIISKRPRFETCLQMLINYLYRSYACLSCKQIVDR